jgi:hypothetical protein
LTRYSGAIDINVEENLFVIDDSTQGAALYRLDTITKLRTYCVAIRNWMRPRLVRFAEDNECLVVGGENGEIYVFRREDGEVVDTLQIGCERLQAMTVRLRIKVKQRGLINIKAVDTVNGPIIVTALAPKAGGLSTLVVWKKKKIRPLEDDDEDELDMLYAFLSRNWLYIGFVIVYGWFWLLQ